MEEGIVPVNGHSRNLCLVWSRNDVRIVVTVVALMLLFFSVIIFYVFSFFLSFFCNCWKKKL